MSSPYTTFSFSYPLFAPHTTFVIMMRRTDATGSD